MEDAKAIVKTEILHMADMQCCKSRKIKRGGWIYLTVTRKGMGIKMSKYYIIIAYDGTEVIDATEDAENRINTMDYMERRHARECRNRTKRRKPAKNPLYRLACLCGIV